MIYFYLVSALFVLLLVLILTVTLYYRWRTRTITEARKSQFVACNKCKACNCSECKLTRHDFFDMGRGGY